ncbi:Protein unc-45 A [Kappamyces sp. JEL0680]|nr:Protein unc-45 A [Kappamyces sp. JEL0680]
MKERIAKDTVLLRQLKSFIPTSDAVCQYAFVVMVGNLVGFQKELSPEEQQLRKLHEMAMSVKKDNAYNSSEHVEERIAALAQQGIIPTIVGLNCESTNMQAGLSRCLLSVATLQSTRGSLIQSGAPRVLLKLANSASNAEQLAAAQALAKIAITTDPHLAFKGELALEVIRPLVELLKRGKLLAQFEALMGLTNLLGVDDLIRGKFIQLGGLPLVKEMQFSTNLMIRRAATEAICNLIFHPIVFGSFMEPNSQILAIMVALSDDDDFATQKAASGTIAILSSEPESIPRIIRQKRFVEIFAGLLKSDKPELVHRAIEVVKNAAAAGSCPAPLKTQAKLLVSSPIPVIAQIAKSIQG